MCRLYDILKYVYKKIDIHSSQAVSLSLNCNNIDVTIKISDFSVLEDWLRIAKPNGIISFTHKSGVWPKWEGEQKRLEDDMKWKCIWISEPLYYLPSYEGCELSERVKVYIYQKM